MCIRYPFLYPRNRFTGLHYNNWKIIEWKKKIYQKYHLVDIDKLHPEVTYETYKGYYFYVKQTGSVIDYWTNWWAKPLCKCITFFHDYILQIFHCIPTYIEWDAVEPGWNKAFGKQYLNDLKKQLKKDKMLYSWRIMDIKEKWGCLNLYYNYGSEELYSLISVYEDISWNTCIKCGKPATHTSKGWISPYCEECVNKDDKYKFIERGSKEEDEYENSKM
jgi:hypothetical protein